MDPPWQQRGCLRHNVDTWIRAFKKFSRQRRHPCNSQPTTAEWPWPIPPPHLASSLSLFLISLLQETHPYNRVRAFPPPAFTVLDLSVLPNTPIYWAVLALTTVLWHFPIWVMESSFITKITGLLRFQSTQSTVYQSVMSAQGYAKFIRLATSLELEFPNGTKWCTTA